jgi:hypothetical protein
VSSRTCSRCTSVRQDIFVQPDEDLRGKGGIFVHRDPYGAGEGVPRRACHAYGKADSLSVVNRDANGNITIIERVLIGEELVPRAPGC